ncbi:MAG TPA: FadR/GntR family transcriptional regulator [Bacillota bacterium]|jgi:GntR family transcriptional repressor for pyruvate dehydrogenase complex|nr:FadR/GntR family transcriptional regulator [Bacillota bacterium]HRS21749.1 FadR/GntR family transcriptional regulator [Clostridia bacterium]HQE67246.1 FadR/GntR family transcriptional regulator [Bacillota bacterium]HQI16659.1 FadR/GntR family transcriptional regulator [Bacillota bacterium]HQJ37456.1 FadR/GntR family transcriptional regulator [Bacillota bacterium]
MSNGFIPISQNIANEISDMIFLQKKYKPNDKLPNEHQLAKELGVSRTTIREAVKILVANGVLTIERGRGTFVTEKPDSQNDPFGISYIEDKKKLVHNWFEMRLVLEPANVRMVVERASDEEIREIIAYEREAAALIASGKPFSEADQRFHAAIAKATHNSVIELMLPAIETAIGDAINTAVYVGAHKRAIENALTNHRNIAHFLEQRDADGAALAMYYHIKRGMTDLDH